MNSKSTEEKKITKISAEINKLKTEKYYRKSMKLLVFSKNQLNWQTVSKSDKERERRHKLWIPD